MIQKPPKFGSKRFRDIVVLAFEGDPIGALSGFYFMATRRRVRGWSRLMVAASKALLNYLRWTRHGEIRCFDEYRQVHRQSARMGPIVALLLDQHAAESAADATIRSLRAALGDVIICSIADWEVGRAGLQALSEIADRSWVLPIAAGDQVSPELGDILARSVDAGAETLIYWDEDRLDQGWRCDPWVKPEWDSLLFGRLGGLVGASIVPFALLASSKLSAVDALADTGSIGRRLLDIASCRQPKHIPLILTHRAGKTKAEAPPTLPPAPVFWPSVSIIIPTRDKPDLLAACLNGVERVQYAGKLQIILVDNASRDPAALELLTRYELDPRVLLLRDDGPFNFSRLNNLAAKAAEGEVLCLLNNDVEPTDGGWLATLARYAVQDGVGAVGAQLVYPNGRIQHAGVAIGVGGAAGHVQKGVDPRERSFWTWHGVSREVSAVTAAVMVVKRSAFIEAGGFDEEFEVAFNDIDFCLRLKQRGLRNIYVAEVRLVHRESESRGDDRTPPEARRFAAELARLKERWDTANYSDPHFSPLLSRLVERCVLVP